MIPRDILEANFLRTVARQDVFVFGPFGLRDPVDFGDEGVRSWLQLGFEVDVSAVKILNPSNKFYGVCLAEICLVVSEEFYEVEAAIGVLVLSFSWDHSLTILCQRQSVLAGLVDLKGQD